MKEILMIFTILLMLLHIFSLLKIRQVPKALDLANHFGSEPKKNFYGPHHSFNKNSFLYNDQSLLSNSDNKMILASGKINQIPKEAENILNPYSPLQ